MSTLKKQLFIAFQHCVPQHLLSRAIGKIADCETPWVKNAFIRWFVKKYQINMSEAREEIPTQYPNFNAFFTRALKDSARPIDTTSGNIVSPADGAISQLGAIENNRLFQAKGHTFSLNALLGGDNERAQQFANGQFATIYLSPRDYHRVHMPIAGTLTHTTYVPGDLFSVNQTTAEGVEQLFARNERLVAYFDTEYGPMAMILVGAMVVAGIETVWGDQEAPRLKKPIHTPFSNVERAPIHLEKGAEMGRFKLGSTVILLFPENKVNWQAELATNSPVQLGKAIAQAL